MNQRQDNKTSELFGESKDFDQKSKQSENYKDFFRHLMFGDIELDEELAKEEEVVDEPINRRPSI